MNEHLLRHAIKHIWCNPAQDRQFVYKLARLTPDYGARGSYSVEFTRFRLPTEKDIYHVYQIGKVVPKLLGVSSALNRWTTLAEMANTNQLFSDLYLTNGIQFPRFESFVLLTTGRNLVVAVKVNDRIGSLDDNDLYLRLYSNAYFDSQRSDVAVKRYVTVRGLRPKTQTELLQFQHQIMDIVSEKGGYPFYYVNGRFVENISLTTAGVGDTVEFVLDASVKRFVEFDIKDLPAFVSTLDNERKLILHYVDPTVQSIEYLDDLDLYLYKPLPTAGRFMGVYYHRNEGAWLRMLTHKDYSIPVERLVGFVRTHTPDPRNTIDPVRWNADNWSDINQLKLRVYFRHSGYERPLQPESHRIQELYRLNSQQIVQAMTGDHALNPLWQAENLERSPYVQFMSASPEFVYPIAFGRPEGNSPQKTEAQEFVGDVYGYHAAASILAKTPSKVYVDQGYRYADLAYEHWDNATVFEYDAQGVLLEHHYHVGGRKYRANNSLCVRVEAITGLGSTELNTTYGNAPVDLPTGYNYRIYVSSKWGGVPKGDWIDITELPNRSDWGYLDDTSENIRWVWTADTSKWYGAVRVDDRFFLQELTFNKSMGHIRFSVASNEIHEGDLTHQIMEIPFGHLDVLLNGRSLIENLDYVVQWPQVVLNNLEYLHDGNNRVLIRGHGFCTSELTRQPVGEVGFVEYGVLSNDGQYDVFTHKVQRIIVDGHYRDARELVFEEDMSELRITDERNGAPFLIQTPAIVFRDVYAKDNVARAEDDVRDKQVSDYMTEYFPKRKRPEPDFIETQYHVFSVFSNKILHDLRNGILYPAGIEDHYSEYDIRRWCKDYEWLLPFDLCNREYNELHVGVYPHWHTAPVGLTIYQYQFYVRVLQTYLNKRPDIAAFVYMER
jgi:hypothetical protein